MFANEKSNITYTLLYWQVREAKTSEQEVGDDKPQPKIKLIRASPVPAPHRRKHIRKVKPKKHKQAIQIDIRPKLMQVRG